MFKIGYFIASPRTLKPHFDPDEEIQCIFFLFVFVPLDPWP